MEVRRVLFRSRLPLGEMLAEVGKTAVERMAPRVDDLRIGQDQADEGGVEPVVRQLVDIEGLGGLALDGGALEEGRTHVGKLLLRRFGQRLDSAAAVLFRLAAKPERERGNVGQLHRALDRRMAAKNLFDRSEEHTSELQSLMRISYAVYCLKK